MTNAVRAMYVTIAHALNAHRNRSDWLTLDYVSAALSISSLIVHAWSVSLLAIAGVRPFSVSCFRAKLYHATNKACIARWCLRLFEGGKRGQAEKGAEKGVRTI